MPLRSGDTVVNRKVQQYGAFNAKLFYKENAYRADGHVRKLMRQRKLFLPKEVIFNAVFFVCRMEEQYMCISKNEEPNILLPEALY